MWKALNVLNYPIKLTKKDQNSENRQTRSNLRGDLLLQGKSDLCNASFILDAFKNWNLAPIAIKESKTLYKAKKEIKNFFCFYSPLVNIIFSQLSL